MLLNTTTSGTTFLGPCKSMQELQVCFGLFNAKGVFHLHLFQSQLTFFGPYMTLSYLTVPSQSYPQWSVQKTSEIIDHVSHQCQFQHGKNSTASKLKHILATSCNIWTLDYIQKPLGGCLCTTSCTSWCTTLSNTDMVWEGLTVWASCTLILCKKGTLDCLPRGTATVGVGCSKGSNTDCLQASSNIFKPASYDFRILNYCIWWWSVQRQSRLIAS